MKRKKAEKMLFFKKKKEENAEIPKYKFLVNLKGDEIEYAIIHFNVTNKANYKDVSFEIMDSLMHDFYVFIERGLMEETDFNEYTKKAREQTEIEYLFNEKRSVIEKKKGIYSLLLKESIFDREDYRIAIPIKNFDLYAFKSKFDLKETVEEQEKLLGESKTDIYGYYIDRNDYMQELHFWIKKDICSVEKLIKLSIDTCKKYGKNIELTYTDETIKE